MSTLQQQHMKNLDKSKVYWFWKDGRQVQISYSFYTGAWVAFYNDSGRPF